MRPAVHPIPEDEIDVLVVGAGQAGLALGRYLQKRGLRFLLLDARERVGDVWRSRWDSLRLYTAAEYDGLPDLPFPAERGTCPGKDDVADYLEHYARHFDLPVRPGARVTRLARAGDGWSAGMTAGTVRARQVVVATGPFSDPRVPPLAASLDAGVAQLHSSAYRRPSDLPAGLVLVVGGGNSGVQIAEELAGAAAGSPWRSAPDRRPCPSGRWAVICSGG
jgi:putative flavoprotein involved in K+ transport